MDPFSFSKRACFSAAQDLALYYSKKQLSLIMHFVKIPLQFMYYNRLLITHLSQPFFHYCC